MKSNPISKTETSNVLREISEQWKMEIPKIKNLTIYEIDETAHILAGEGLVALRLGKTYLPFLSDVEILKKVPKCDC